MTAPKASTTTKAPKKAFDFAAARVERQRLRDRSRRLERRVAGLLKSRLTDALLGIGAAREAAALLADLREPEV